ncbi:MAG TPA: ribosome silencing factor [Thermoanaerobaculia bacterium]|jgi:ribosome-associated protein|nr:ribosome silencing factor [Thermoanaerobaculia bacterium]
MAAATPTVPSETAADERAKKREERNAAIDEKLLDEVKRGISALLDRKAEKLVVLDLVGLTSMADYFVLATATNDRQAQAMADAVEMALKSAGRRPSSIEGYAAAAWILLDYGDVIFHVFHDEARRFYGLERLWGDATDRTERFVSEPKTRPVSSS